MRLFRNACTVLLIGILIFLIAGCKTVSTEPVQPTQQASDTPEPTPILLGDASFPADTTELKLVADPDDLEKLALFPGLKSVDLSGSTCYAEIRSFMAEHPDLDVFYTVCFDDQTVPCDAKTLSVSSLPDPSLLGYLPNLESIEVSEPLSPATVVQAADYAPGAKYVCSIKIEDTVFPSDVKELDLSGVSPDFCEDVLAVIPFLPNLTDIQLNPESGISSWPIDKADSLQSARDGLTVTYTTEAFGVVFSLNDEVVSFNDIDLSEKKDELLALLPHMHNIGRLDMEECGIPDEEMAALREQFPSPKIVWRVHLKLYSCRTDSVMIRCSYQLERWMLTNEDVVPLRYCNEVHYLDLGHNQIESASFVQYMPELEVCIVAVGPITDISAIKNCPKLEYCEFLSGRVSDISSLAACTELKHLNLSKNKITDITPLYGLTKLERLWISLNWSIPKEQIEEFKRRVPNCEVNFTARDPTDEGWRYDRHYRIVPRYEKLREQFQYDRNIFYYTADSEYYVH